MNESVRFGLARLAAERCCQDFDIPINNLMIMEETIAEVAGIDSEKVRALLWGDTPELDIEESETLAIALGFHPELFSCLVRPTSMEIILHTLRSLAADLDPSCEDCQDMRDWIEEAELLERETVGQLCLDLLDHIRVGEEAEEIENSSLREDEEAMLGVFRGLSPDARARVLAFAFSERGGAPADQQGSNSYIYSRLRDDYLSPLARRVLDQLASHPDGLMTARELAAGLDLADARSVGQVPRSLQSSLRALRADGYTLEEPPLQVRRRGRESVYRLSPQALRFWRAMVEAGRAVGEGHRG